MFKSRFDAAQEMIRYLVRFKDNKNAIILAIPRGGLQIGYVLAKELHVPLDVALTKKIGHPTQEEYAIGAVSLTGEVLDPKVSREVSPDYIKNQIKEIRATLRERYKKYLGGKKPHSLEDKIVILTDDGVATGKTMLATIDLVKKDKPKKIIVAIPVAPLEAISMLEVHVDEVICLSTPPGFSAVGQFYENFEQVSDEEAITLLKEANK